MTHFLTLISRKFNCKYLKLMKMDIWVFEFKLFRILLKLRATVAGANVGSPYRLTECLNLGGGGGNVYMYESLKVSSIMIDRGVISHYDTNKSENNSCLSEMSPSVHS